MPPRLGFVLSDDDEDEDSILVTLVALLERTVVVVLPFVSSSFPPLPFEEGVIYDPTTATPQRTCCCCLVVDASKDANDANDSVLVECAMGRDGEEEVVVEVGPRRGRYISVRIFLASGWEGHCIPMKN